MQPERSRDEKYNASQFSVANSGLGKRNIGKKESLRCRFFSIVGARKLDGVLVTCDVMYHSI